MRSYRTTILLFLLLFISLFTTAQPTGSPKTLLWRISGRGLQKPSYLYGTMHLTDKRLFQFGDSVYHAIEQSEGLAIEVNPDELAAYYVNRLFDQVENTKKLDEILKPADFKKYSTSLAKKFNKPASDITARDIVKEKNKWMSDYMEKGEMPTFVDAYLYNIARRQGKWLGGIEDITDQTGLLEDLVDKSDIEYILAGDANDNSKEINKGMEHMIALYTSQDIDGIEAFSNGTESAAKKDRMLIRRNIKMARRIDSLASLRSMFLAIGAAHLPGDTGVIDLLRKRGFTVEPVFSSRKLNEKEYTFKEVSVPWYPVDDSQGLYHTAMPGNPASVKLYGLIEMKFLLDIFNMAGYCTMAVPGALEFSGNDSACNELARRMLQTEHIPAAKTIYNDGVEGREYFQEKKGANLRLQVFAYKKIVYTSFMYATKPAFMHTDYADKFFNALVINKNAVLAASSSVFTDSVMGIRFTAPAIISYNKKFSKPADPGWKISAFTGTDLSTGSYIMLFSKEVKPGHYVQADSLIYKDFNDNMSKQYKLLQQEEKRVQGYPAIKITGRNILQPSFYMVALNMLQNGRDIVIMAIVDSAHLHSPGIDNMFESLQLVPHPAANWKLYSSPDGRFSSQAPAAIQSYIYTTDHKEQFYAYDTTTSVTYSIIPDTLNKYFQAKDDSSYWKKRIADNQGDDSLLQETRVQNGQLSGVELLLKEPKNKSRYKRMRLLVDGDKLYKLFVSAEKDFLYSSHTNDFFSAFSVNTASADSLFYLRSKTALLMQDLAGKDSASRYNAYMALNTAWFTEKDREALQEAVFKEYPSLYDSALSDIINNEITRKLAALNSNATVAFVKSRYAMFSERKDTLKNIALSVLAQLHTKESYAALAQLLQQSPPQQHFSYRVTNGLSDSLALTAGIYTSLQQLAVDTIHTGSIARIASELLDSGFIKMDQVKASQTAFIQAADRLLPALLRNNQRNEYDVYQLLTLLGRFKTAAADAMVKSYLAVKSTWLKQTAAIALIKNNQPVPVAVLKSLAANKATRYSLYTDLKEINKKKLFPAQYFTQPYFSESAVYAAATDEDEGDGYTSMALLYKKTAKYKNKPYIFYLYKVMYDTEDGPTTYLAIAGGYAAGKTGIEPDIDLSGVYRQEKLDSKNATALLTAYLEELEKNTREAPEE